LPYHQAALKASPQHTEYRRFYRNNRWRFAETLLDLKDHAAAAQAAGQFLQAAVEHPRDAYTAACLLAGCARLAQTDPRLSSDYGKRALTALRQAVDTGDVAQIQKDANLDSLRARGFSKTRCGANVEAQALGLRRIIVAFTSYGHFLQASHQAARR